MNNSIFEHIDRFDERVNCLYPDECESINAGNRSEKLCWHSIYGSISGFIPALRVPSTAIIAFDPNGKVALIQRRDTKSWLLPGGEIGWGESIKKNTHRSLAKQLGLESIKIRHTAGLDFFTANSQPHSFSVIVVVDVEGEIQIKDSLDVADARFFSLDSLPLVKQPI